MDQPSRLLLLVDVAELGSFSEAAKRRELDRSVVSKHIARLEQELGVRLLNRSTRSLSLTQAGFAMVQQGRELREWMYNTQALAENLQQAPSGRLKISAPGILGRCLGFEAMRRFREHYPDVEVDLQLEERRVDVIGEGYDLVLRVGDIQDSTLVSSPLAPNHLLIGASPEFIERHGEPRDLATLSRLPALTFSSLEFQVDYLPYLDEQGREQKLPLNSQMRTSEAEVVKRGVMAGMGIGVLPAFAMSDEVKEGKIVPLMTDLPLPAFGIITLLYPHREMPLRTRRFIEILREMVGTPPKWEAYIPGFAEMYGKAAGPLGPVADRSA
ncbi:LysR family transcriptional regulator [Halomonas denitrificans]|uniref:LysR family transcriptional regulator n=1 Tax=Halomonas TaxID=2745 RepID=UPI001C987040|nr:MULTISPECIES: LysR family transcriptional regulator [Halomonas]MED5294751.1 LysR family transcriptional regulator [Pseudomonadota bacterium]MBY5929864.1 LysR family transcriptional regulator [Halomonas sp. DP8Y7-3]MBY5968387.1 LysR family transcriptional regulator [Halomonas denitrificans]MBY6028181.1 LysR family transcriptional regulator [Halomonas sp. DP8Y7-1]MCA0975257.1 LysR family transcriptional regulator [Halomonas denitrificans]